MDPNQPGAFPEEQGGGAVPPKPGGDESNKDARTLAMLAHLLGALFGFLGPLIIWLIKKDEYAFVDDQGKEALNFHLMLIIAYLASMILVVCSFGLLFFVPFIPYVFQLVFGIMGAMQANNGQYYRYPVTIRFIR